MPYYIVYYFSKFQLYIVFTDKYYKLGECNYYLGRNLSLSICRKNILKTNK